MDVLTFLAKVIDSVAWPAVVVTILWLFRPPLISLINAIKEAKFKIFRGETTIEGELNTVREKIEAAPKAALPDPIKQLATQSPNQAIERSWKNLEQTASAAVSASASLPVLRIADLLIENKVLEAPEAEAFFKLYEIQKEAIRPEGRYVADVSSATSYGSLAYALSKRIKPESGHNH